MTWQKSFCILERENYFLIFVLEYITKLVLFYFYLSKTVEPVLLLLLECYFYFYLSIQCEYFCHFCKNGQKKSANQIQWMPLCFPLSYLGVWLRFDRNSLQTTGLPRRRREAGSSLTRLAAGDGPDRLLSSLKDCWLIHSTSPNLISRLLLSETIELHRKQELLKGKHPCLVRMTLGEINSQGQCH